MSFVLGLCYGAAYIGGWAVIRAAADVASKGSAPRPSLWGIGLWCVVAIPSLLQIALPGMLAAGRRDAAAIADGEWWRLVTSMGLQDGGWFGTLFNLVALAISVAVVGEVFSGPMLIITFVSGGVIGNLLTLAVFGDSGAGNSMATMFMVAAAAVVATYGRRRSHRLQAPMVVLIATTVVLCALRDQHGFALASGLVVGLGLARFEPDSVSP